MSDLDTRWMSLLVGGVYFCRRQQDDQWLYLPHTLHKEPILSHSFAIGLDIVRVFVRSWGKRDCSLVC